MFRPVARSPHSELAGARVFSSIWAARLTTSSSSSFCARCRGDSGIEFGSASPKLQRNRRLFARSLRFLRHVSICWSRIFGFIFWKTSEDFIYLVGFLAILNDAAVDVGMIGELFVDQNQQRFEPRRIQEAVAVFFGYFNDETTALDVFIGFPLRLDSTEKKIRQKLIIINKNKFVFTNFF